MKQIIQNLKNGETVLIDVPAPQPSAGKVVIQSSYSLISPGTERMLVAFGNAGWIGKVKQQPERLKQVWDKVKTDGIKPTAQAVLSKLNRPIPIGYSNVGRVIAVGEGVSNFAVGDRVVSNGPHAEIVTVPENLCAKVPAALSDEDAVFTVIGAVALQSIRLLQPTFGETVVVQGLGLVGILAAQLLKANGCNVIGVEPDGQRCLLAQRLGIKTISPDNALAYTQDLGKQKGIDGVIVATSSADDSIMSLAAQMCRKRGRIILVGIAGLHLNRADFYEKEIRFQVSSSYGPGRYDFQYEAKGQDYPVAFVRWTAQRNFEAFLNALVSGSISVQELISDIVPLEHFESIYQHIEKSSAIATLFRYSGNITATNIVSYSNKVQVAAVNEVAVVGAGNFTNAVVLPILQKLHYPLTTIISGNGLSAAVAARQFSIPVAGSSYEELLQKEAVNTVIITTTHHLHAPMLTAALHKHKNVFVEKPLAINWEQLRSVEEAYIPGKGSVMIGFNRRFAPFTQKLKALLPAQAQCNIVYTVNAGNLPAGHWINDKEIGGGRIVSELCHFIDWCGFVTGVPVTAVCAHALQSNAEDVLVLLKFANNSSAGIQYLCNGSKAYDKERIEVYSEGKTVVIQNWKKMTGYGFKHFSSVSAQQDKGHQEQFKRYQQFLQGKENIPISFDAILNSSKATLAVIDSIRERKWVDI